MKHSGFVYLIAYAFCMGLISVFTRHLQDLDLITVTFLRAALATLFIAIIAIAQNEWKTFKPVYISNTLLVALFQCTMNICFVGAIMYTSVTNTILLTYTAPCFTILYTSAVEKQRIPAATVISIGFILLGLLIVVDPRTLSLSSGNALGDLFGLGAGISYAAMTVAAKPLSSKVSSRYIVFWQHLLIVGLLFPVAQFDSHLLMVNALPISGLGIVCTGLAYFFFMQGVQRVLQKQALVMTSVEPVIAILIAALFLNETITGLMGIGAALIITGAYCVTAELRAIPKSLAQVGNSEFGVRSY